ncbi:MAG: hypothetical protein ICV51_09340 [Flavisolibacter sp.]|nr:hypothetical protein [Flavisolibacter sp.]
MKNILVAVILSAFLSCKKEVTELPPATQTGANTFGANVNGKLWKSQGFGFAPTAPLLEARYSINYTIVINARNFASEPLETEFEIYLSNVTAPGTYLLNANTDKYPNQNGNYAYYVERKINPLNEWITNNQYSGRVEITKADTVNHIFSGTFSFQAANMDGRSAPLSVTDGRFDVKVQ